MNMNMKLELKKIEEFFKPSTAAKKSLQHNNNLITPTLAEVYLKQGHFDKAISAYEKLIFEISTKKYFLCRKN